MLRAPILREEREQEDDRVALHAEKCQVACISTVMGVIILIVYATGNFFPGIGSRIHFDGAYGLSGEVQPPNFLAEYYQVPKVEGPNASCAAFKNHLLLQGHGVSVCVCVFQCQCQCVCVCVCV